MFQAREYMCLCDAYPPRCLKIAKKHVFQMLFGGFMAHPHLRNKVFASGSSHEISAAIEEVAQVRQICASI